MRLLARRDHRPLTQSEVAARAGLSVGCVSKLSRLRSWDGVRIGTMLAFCRACGVDFLRLKRQRYFLLHRRLAHLRQREQMFKRLLLGDGSAPR